ncbi:hypothetical protein [Capsulimonas corticalis]|nr:hypothetical protein [Capsulimonas corticalis]
MMSERSELQEAQDPQTPAHRLRELAAKQRSSAVARAVAENPNSPPDLLAALCHRIPEAVLNNPALPLVLLENPAWTKRLAPEAALQMLKFETAPADLLHMLARQPGLVGHTARLHVGIAGECGPNWESEAREALWESSGLPGRDGNFPVRLLELDLVAGWLAEPLAAHWDSKVRRATARSPHTPREVLQPLRRAGGSHDLNSVVPADPAMPSPALERLARGGSWAKRLAARHPNTPIAVLEKLASEDNEAIRWSLVKNPSTPTHLIAGLTTKLGDNFRRGCARDPETPPASLEIFASDAVRDVRWMAARNPHTPPSALSALTRDVDARVRQGVGRNASASAELLALLAGDSGRWVRLAAARHRNTPADALAALAADEDEEVRQSVARRDLPPAHPPTPSMKKAPPALLSNAPRAKPARTAAHPVEVTQLLHSAWSRGEWLEKAVALSCPNVDPKDILEGAIDPLWTCRIAVARNPALLLFALERPELSDLAHRLARDGNRLVRAAARASLEEQHIPL